MNENLKRKLAQKNGNEASLDKEIIIKGIREKYSHLDDEVAILRKIVVVLARKVKEQHPDVDLSEIEEYNEFVESVKNRRYEYDR